MEKLKHDPSSIAAITEDGRIGWVNRGWLEFARANGGERAAIHVGDNYFAGIGGETRGLFEAAVAECLASGIPVEHEYECSTARVQRVYRLRMLPLSKRSLLLVHHPIAGHSHDRPAEPPEEVRYRDASGQIVQCGNCRRTRTFRDQAWHWVPAWVERPPTGISYVPCPVCRGFSWRRAPRELPPRAARAALSRTR
jgi:hypothetical protein